MPKACVRLYGRNVLLGGIRNSKRRVVYLRFRRRHSREHRNYFAVNGRFGAVASIGRKARLHYQQGKARSKLQGYPPSQNDDERDALQAETQAYFELFKSHVLAHRNIEKEDMRGQAFVGAEALRRGLVDDICDKNSAYDKLRILTRG